MMEKRENHERFESGIQFIHAPKSKKGVLSRDCGTYTVRQAYQVRSLHTTDEYVECTNAVLYCVYIQYNPRNESLWNDSIHALEHNELAFLVLTDFGIRNFVTFQLQTHKDGVRSPGLGHRPKRR